MKMRYQFQRLQRMNRRSVLYLTLEEAIKINYVVSIRATEQEDVTIYGCSVTPPAVPPHLYRPHTPTSLRGRRRKERRERNGKMFARRRRRSPSVAVRLSSFVPKMFLSRWAANTNTDNTEAKAMKERRLCRRPWILTAAARNGSWHTDLAIACSPSIETPKVLRSEYFPL